MKTVDTLTHLTGLYALTREGGIGIFRDAKSLVLDEALTHAFAHHNREFLAAYLAAPDANDHRLGLIYRASGRRPWGAETFLLQEEVVRHVYPVSGQSLKAELTSFQKKNLEKSIYRAIELLVDYRFDDSSDVPVYCPILFDRGTTLGGYGLSTATADSATPVLEVLNLVAAVPIARHNTAEILLLMQNMRQSVVRKEMRDERFVVQGDAGEAPSAVGAGGGIFGRDKPAPRVTLVSAAELQQRIAAAEQVQASQRVEQVERYRNPHRTVDAERLRRFTPCHGAGADRLELLVKRVSVYTASGGSRLLNQGMSDAWNMFLLDGTVSLEAQDGGALLIEGGSAKAASAIASLKPRKYNVTAVTSVSFLWIHDALLQAVLAGAPAPASFPPK